MKGVNPRAPRILALVILCFLPMIAEEFVENAGMSGRFPHFIGSSTTVDFLLGPLLFLYARSLTEPDRALSSMDRLQFIPFALVNLVLLPFFVLPGDEKLRAVANGLPLSFEIVIAAKIPLATIYLTLIIRRLRAFIKRRDNPRARDPNVVWLYRSMIGLAAVAVSLVVLGVLPAFGILEAIDPDMIGMIFICISVYMVSALLIQHPFARVSVPAYTSPEPSQVIFDQPRVKYQTSPLSEDQKKIYSARLQYHLERDRPYLDMSLDLEKLSAALTIPPAHLSQVINEQLGMNFYELVNLYRVREVEARISDPEQSGKTLMAIAYESGFNSKASFNRAFKRVTGTTPSEYARQRR